ncbi:hypothetical protein AB1Y20_023744 [Prymnesium parvum]|uniref:Nucleotide-diphospho-sugar transferase domain-containing protein n=1 Tax=Prymnesium parvum TaxID=97485 RepID=A0AB34JHS3_PRYPA
MGKSLTLAVQCLLLLALAASLHLIGCGLAAISSTVIGTILRHSSSRHASAELFDAAAATNSLRLVFVTFANSAQADFALNWLAHLAAYGRAALVGATDESAARTLSAAGAVCFGVPSAIGEAEAKWGSAGFAQMGRTKAALVARLLAFNLTLFFADADVAFLRDPFDYVQQRLRDGAQLLFHTDAFSASDEAVASRDSSLEAPRIVRGVELNTGLFVMTPPCLPLAAEWARSLASDAAFANWMNDQQALNRIVRRGVDFASPRPLLRVYDQSLALGVLPAHLFPSGHVFFIQRLNARLALRPFAVHLTFQNCDQSGKRHRMREAHLWLVDPPEYYQPDGGLLSYTPDLPSHLTAGFHPLEGRNVRADDHVFSAHFALINHQLAQLRTALALSLALNRTLLLPRFLCGLETVTNFAHSGVRCRDCAMALPYWCPADHVLRMHYLAGVMPQRPQLPLRVREHSMLYHPAAPPIHASDRVRIALEGGAASRCAHCGRHGYLPDDAAAARVAAAASAAGRMSEAEVVRHLAPFSSRRVLHFDNLRPSAFEVRLEPTARANMFDETIKPLGGGWCCVEPEKRGGVGHYWYDMLFDRAHRDRFGRTWDTGNTWRPTPGP